MPNKSYWCCGIVGYLDRPLELGVTFDHCSDEAPVAYVDMDYANNAHER